MARILNLDWKVPEKLRLTDEVKNLLGQIFVKDAAKRITISQIKQHPWYLHRLPWELSDGYQGFERRACARARPAKLLATRCA